MSTHKHKTTTEFRSGTIQRSSYRGVCFKNGRWVAWIGVEGGPQKYLGRFDSEEAAARAYDERAKATRDSPVLNFLPDGSLNPNRKKRGRHAGQRAASAAVAAEDERTVAIEEEEEEEEKEEEEETVGEKQQQRKQGRC